MPSRPLRVLIIDDHPLFRAAARELLERRGLSVVAEAASAASGLETAERIAPDVVLVDLRLPDGDGFDVCHALTRRDPEIAVVVVSAEEPPGHLVRIRDCGA